MKAIKEILTENRESVISSIKWVFKVWRNEDVKVKMIEFLAFCEEHANIEGLNESTKIKNDLKFFVQRMSTAQQKEKNLRMYGTERPKLADLVNYAHEDETYDILKKEWVKN